MADTVVLVANVSIDPSGVVSGVNTSVAAQARLEKATKSLGGATIPTSAALRAMGVQLGGLAPLFARLGPAAAALGIAYGTVRAVMRAPEVAAFTAEVSKMSAAFGTAVIQSLGLSNALQSVTKWLKGADEALAGPESFDDALKRMGLKDTTGQIGDLVQILGRVREEFMAGRLPAANAVDYITQIAEAAKKLNDEGQKLPKVLQQIQALLPGPDFTAIQAKAAGIGKRIAAEEVDAMIKRFDAAADAQNRWNEAMDIFNNASRSMSDHIQELEETVPDLHDLFAESNFGDIFTEWANGISVAQVQFELLQTSMQAVAKSLSQAFIEGTGSSKAFLHDLLADISRICFSYAAMFAAMAVASTTGIGAGLLQGTPAQFAKAAALFAAAGAGAGLAARAIGGGTSGVPARAGGGGGGGGGRGFSGPGAIGGASTSVVVTIQGSVIGNDLESLKRDIAQWVRTAQEDGVA